jgi:leucyl aminopeptidase
MSLTKIYRNSGECLKTETLPLPKTLVDHPNPTYTSSKLSLSSRQVRRKPSATTNVAERDSAEAEAGVNGGVAVAQPSQENPVILRLKKILSMKSDQTVIEVSPMLTWYSHLISMFR